MFSDVACSHEKSSKLAQANSRRHVAERTDSFYVSISVEEMVFNLLIVMSHLKQLLGRICRILFVLGFVSICLKPQVNNLRGSQSIFFVGKVPFDCAAVAARVFAA